MPSGVEVSFVASGLDFVPDWPPSESYSVYFTFGETDFREELKTLDLPGLVLHGDKDVSAPLEMTARQANFPHVC